MSTKLKILNVDPDGYSSAAKIKLQQICLYEERNLTRSDLLNQIHSYDVLIIRLSHKIDFEVIKNGIKLKAVATNATGLDHIDIQAAETAGIKIISLKGETEFLNSISSTAELTWGLILALLRNITQAALDVQMGQWQRENFVGRDLSGKCLGLVGFGRIGKMIARYGLAFNMNIRFFDPIFSDDIDGIDRASSIEALFEWSDILSVHVPLSNETRNFISLSLFALMKPTAYFVNTSRGSLVKEDDLLIALQNRLIAGAALDVLSNELDHNFLKNNKLYEYSKSNRNLIITPHIGGASLDAWEKTEYFICEKLFNFLLDL